MVYRRNKISSTAQVKILSALPIMSGGAAFLSLSFLLVLISFIQPAIWSSVRVAATDVFAPVLAAVRAPVQGAADMLTNAAGLAELQAENARLQAENERLRSWYQKAMALEVENKSLQSLLNVQSAPEWDLLTARVLADSSSAYAHSFLIAAGTDQNLRAGQPVIAGDGVLGRIVEVGRHTSRVLLLTDMNARIPVVVDRTNTHAILAGANDAQPTLTHADQDTAFQKGDRLLTSGFGGAFPAGLPVGVVSDVNTDDIRVTPFTDTKNIHHVQVIMLPQTPNLRLGPGS